MLLRQLGTTIFAATVIVVAWTVVYVDWLLALVVQLFVTAWVAITVTSPERLFPEAWWHVRSAEVRRYRYIGAVLYNDVLSLTGWNRAIEADRGFDGTRAGLAVLERGTQRSEAAHVLLLLGTFALVTVAFVLDRIGLACWLLVFAVVFHAYPVMVQRTLRRRVRQVQARRMRYRDDEGTHRS